MIVFEPRFEMPNDWTTIILFGVRQRQAPTTKEPSMSHQRQPLTPAAMTKPQHSVVALFRFR